MHNRRDNYHEVSQQYSEHEEMWDVQTTTPYDHSDLFASHDILDMPYGVDDLYTYPPPGNRPCIDLASTLIPPGPSSVTFDDPGLVSPSHPVYFSTPGTLAPPPDPECDIYLTDLIPVAPYPSPWHIPKTVRNLSFHSAFVSLNSFHH